MQRRYGQRSRSRLHPGTSPSVIQPASRSGASAGLTLLESGDSLLSRSERVGSPARCGKVTTMSSSSRTHRRRIGEILVNEGLVTPEQLEEALRVQKKTG